MFEYILSMDFNTYLLFFAIGLISQLVLLKKVLFSWYDPLFIYCLTNSCSIGFVAYLFWDNQIESNYFYSFVTANIFLVIGLILGDKKIHFSHSLSKINNLPENDYIFRLYSKQLTAILWIGLIIIAIGNLLLIAKFGTLPLLSENPDVAKLLFRTEGFGTIYRINDALIPVCLAIAALKLFHPTISPNKYQVIFLRIALLLLIFFLLSGGSKSSILTIIGLLFYIYLINKKFNIKKAQKIDFYTSILLVLGIGVVILIFWQASIVLKYFDFSELLLIRLVGYGDVFYYFYKYDLKQAFDYNFFSFVEYLFNPLLSLLRLSDYQTALGEQIITQAIGLTTNGFGVNPQHSIEGLIYFGYSWFWVYSLSIGYAISVIRTRFFRFILKKPHQLNLSMYTILSFQIIKLPTDCNLFFESLYSMLLIAIPVFLYVYIFFGGQLKSAKMKWK